MTPKSADQSKRGVSLHCEVCRHIRASQYGIADISAERANVYFEIGLLLAWKRRSCILAENRFFKNIQKDFSDMAGVKVLKYKKSDLAAMKKELKGWLNDAAQDDISTK